MMLKAHWIVTAGLIPGEGMSDYGKRWSYTSADYEADGGKRGELFESMASDAQEYAAGLINGGLNWAHVEYMWM